MNRFKKNDIFILVSQLKLICLYMGRLGRYKNNPSIMVFLNGGPVCLCVCVFVGPL